MEPRLTTSVFLFWGAFCGPFQPAAFGEFWGLSLIKKGGLFIFLGGFSQNRDFGSSVRVSTSFAIRSLSVRYSSAIRSLSVLGYTITFVLR